MHKSNYRLSPNKLDFFIVLVNKGASGAHIIHNSELDYPPNLEMYTDYNTTFLENISSQIIHALAKRVKFDKPWLNSQFAPDFIVPYLDSFFFIDSTTYINYPVSIYAANRKQLKQICEDSTKYRNKQWFHTLSHRVGAIIVSTLILSTITGCNNLPEAPTIEAKTVIKEQPEVSEQTVTIDINEYLQDVPYLSPLDDTLTAYVCLDNPIKLVYIENNEIKILYGQEAASKYSDLRKGE